MQIIDNQSLHKLDNFKFCSKNLPNPTHEKILLGKYGA